MSEKKLSKHKGPTYTPERSGSDDYRFCEDMGFMLNRICGIMKRVMMSEGDWKRELQQIRVLIEAQFSTYNDSRLKHDHDGSYRKTLDKEIDHAFRNDVSEKTREEIRDKLLFVLKFPEDDE